MSDPGLNEAGAASKDSDPFESSFLMKTYGPRRVCFLRGEGARLYDDSGKEYVDFLAGIAVVSLGHSNSIINNVLIEQSKKLWHVSNYFYNENAGRLAKAIDEKIASKSNGRVFFCNSGAEANEAAIKLARRWGGADRFEIIAMRQSFHGRTMGALAATGQFSKKLPFLPMLEGFTHVEFGDIAALRSAIGPNTAAVLLEPIQGEAGVIDPPPDYLDQVEELCRETGVLLILDEVQTGLCRTGKWFAFQHSSISPDIVLLAKALGNGIPIGAVWAKEAVAGAFQAGDHGSTFGGGALATAVGLCVIGEMERLGIADAANRSSSILRNALMRIGLVKSLTGRGLLVGVELSKPVAAKFVSLALEYGLVLSHTGPQRLRIAPPLVITPEEIAKGVAIFERVANEFS